VYNIEEELLEKAKDGDISSFEQLILGYEKLIYNVCYRIMSNPDDAKDISQEVLIKIYRNIDKCKDIKSFKSWVYAIINNACIDEIRKRKGKYTDSLDDSIDSEEGSIDKQIPSSDLTPEQVMVRTETVDEVQTAISKLPEKYRILIVLRDIQGLSYDDISNITSDPLGTIKSRLSRARKSLKDIILKDREQKIF